jgi:predicted phosphatase
MKVGRMRYRIEVEDLIKITDQRWIYFQKNGFHFAEVWADITSCIRKRVS